MAFLPTGQYIFRGKDTGMIFYPSLPHRLAGTEKAGRPDFDITWPYDYPQWVANMHSEHATVEVVWPKDAKKLVDEIHELRFEQFALELDGKDARKVDGKAESLKKRLPPHERVIWWGGTVHDGIWMGDKDTALWRGGCWRDGIVLGGHFTNCSWINGEKRGGFFHSGVWYHGIHRGGFFGGLWLNGSWEGGEFYGYRERTNVPPGLVQGNGCDF